jgi:hypothetical protein
MPKSKFNTKKKPKRARAAKPRAAKPRTGGARSNAWRAYVGGGRGYTVSNAPIPD